MRILIFLIFGLFSILSYSQNDYERFSKSDLLKDLHLLYQNAAKIHPKLAYQSNLDDFTQLYESQKEKIKDSLNLNQFYLIAAPLLASLNDAHTNVMPSNSPRIKYMLHNNGLSFPFDVSITSDSIYLTHYYGNNAITYNRNEPVQSINGILVIDILAEMRRLTGAKKQSIQNVTVERYFRSYIWMIWGFENGFDIVFQIGKGIQVPGIDNNTFIQNRITKNRTNYSIEIDSLKKTAFLKIKSFAHLESFVPFVDSAFEAIQNANCKNLVVDVRDNMGGRSIVVDSLMNYLTNQPYRQYKTIRTRVSVPLKKYYENKPEKLKLINELPSDTILETIGTETLPHKKSSRFKGKLFVKVNGTTFSAAATFAGLIKHLGIGKIVGEETGGTIGYYGDYWFQKLPNTQITYYIAPKEFVQFGGVDLKHGVIPDLTEIDVDRLK